MEEFVKQRRPQVGESKHRELDFQPAGRSLWALFWPRGWDWTESVGGLSQNLSQSIVSELVSLDFRDLTFQNPPHSQLESARWHLRAQVSLLEVERRSVSLGGRLRP